MCTNYLRERERDDCLQITQSHRKHIYDRTDGNKFYAPAPYGIRPSDENVREHTW